MEEMVIYEKEQKTNNVSSTTGEKNVAKKHNRKNQKSVRRKSKSEYLISIRSGRYVNF